MAGSGGIVGNLSIERRFTQRKRTIVSGAIGRAARYGKWHVPLMHGTLSQQASAVWQG